MCSIFPHPEWLECVRFRMEVMLDQRHSTSNLPDEL